MRYILKINDKKEIICSSVKYCTPNKKARRQYFNTLKIYASEKSIDITVIDSNNNNKTIVCFCNHDFPIGVIQNIQSLLLTSEK